LFFMSEHELLKYVRTRKGSVVSTSNVDSITDYNGF